MGLRSRLLAQRSPSQMKSMLRLTIGILNLIWITPSFSAVILISETRSVTASYYGGGIETITSDGTFGLFEALAVGTPFGGGLMSAYQESDITPTGFTIQHSVADNYGPGGWAKSSFTVDFLLSEDSRITIDGYCNYFSGFASLTSGSQTIPLVWGPDDIYRNYLTFDQVLGPGLYTFTTYEIPRETVSTRIDLRFSSVPDEGSSAWMLAIGTTLFALSGRAALRRRVI